MQLDEGASLVIQITRDTSRSRCLTLHRGKYGRVRARTRAARIRAYIHTYIHAHGGSIDGVKEALLTNVVIELFRDLVLRARDETGA